MNGRVIAGWAGLGVTLTSATQLRIGGLPIGPGEALLALWMAVFGLLLMRGMRFSYSNAFRPFALFWALSAILLAIGSLVAINLHKHDAETAQHNALAFAFAGPLTCMLAIRVGDVSNQQYYLSLARATFITTSVIALVLLAASLVTSQVGPISLWYSTYRYRGWANNPNQLAMFMAPMPFLGWYLLQRTRGWRRKLLYVPAISVCMAVGLATDSDGLKVAWAGAAGVVAAWLWCRLLVRGRGNFLPMATGYFFIPVIVLAVMAGVGDQLVALFERILEQVYEKGDRGQIGMTVLMHGLQALSQSPLVGWGPGSYSGLYGPFGGFEAHNTVVDWGMSTGVPGILLYLGLMFWCAVGAIRSGSPWLLGAFLTMAADSVFGYSLRQPFFWLMLVLTLTLSEQAVRQTTSSVIPSRKGTMSTTERAGYALRMRSSRREARESATRIP